MNLRDEHYKRLNTYRHSIEYLVYARMVGINPTVTDADKLPKLCGTRWAIDERIYNEFLNMLPPLNHRSNSFLLREFVFGTITTKYSKVGDRYFCEFVDAKEYL